MNFFKTTEHHQTRDVRDDRCAHKPQINTNMYLTRQTHERAQGACALARATTGTRCGPRSLCCSSAHLSEVRPLSSVPRPPPPPIENKTPHSHIHPPTHPPTQPSPPPTPASRALPGLPTRPSPLAPHHPPLPLSGAPRRWSASSRAADAAWGSAGWRKAWAGPTSPSSWPARARATSCTGPPPAGHGWGWGEDSGWGEGIGHE